MAKGALTNEAGAQHYAKAADYVKLADAVRRTDHSNTMTSGAKCDHRKAFSLVMVEWSNQFTERGPSRLDE
jgi:hypothetical protein